VLPVVVRGSAQLVGVVSANQPHSIRIGGLVLGALIGTGALVALAIVLMRYVIVPRCMPPRHGVEPTNRWALNVQRINRLTPDA